MSDETKPWDGRPQNPERSGWHWATSYKNNAPSIYHWSVEVGTFAGNLPENAGPRFTYHRPVLTLEEHDALLSERVALRAERDDWQLIAERQNRRNTARTLEVEAVLANARAGAERMTDTPEFPPEVVEAVRMAIDLARDDLTGDMMPFEASALAVLRTIIPHLPALGYRRVQPGEVVVPMEPTEAMKEAGAYAVDLAMYPENGAATYPSAAGDGYRAMLAAEKGKG